ncbi:penicillin acylase family protein [Methylomonas sp. HYX-M1]|uniref:penicillin acylase family protein n=1 Tax=Methylomonas sp. HYX-M1 TaxID=3139307 RepID=UPI00345B8226
MPTAAHCVVNIRALPLGLSLSLVLCLAIGGGLFIGLDQGPEKLSAAGLSDTVEIVTDRYGVPHVYAASITDAYLTLGYLHAQERLWQMDLNRRAGSGRLAELLGEQALPQDRFFRVLGLQRAAQANWQQLDQATRTALQAYADGVNAYLDQAHWLPVEYYLLGAGPERWQPQDSLVWLKTLAWNLSGNWWEELLNFKLQQRLPPKHIADLFPGYPYASVAGLPEYPGNAAATHSLTERLLAFGRLPAKQAVGSNNWAVDGSRSTSGKPILANDPHLPLTAPSLWYFAHLHAPGLDAIGATLPGIPGVVLGRNRQVAWAFTNTGPDSQDLYFEQTLPGQTQRYRTPEGAAEFERIDETIRIKGGQTENLTVRLSRHGPLLSDADPDAAQLASDGLAIALNWSGLAADDSTIRFILNAGTAANADALRQMARDFHAPQQNIVYADAAGQIGFIAAGRVPLRDQRNVLSGRLPAPGWDSRYDWQGWIPFDDLPQQTGAADGKIVTANQDITPPNYPYFITANWALPYRAERISALLDATERHDTASFAAIQADIANPLASELLPFLLATPATLETQQALVLLRAWDGGMREDSPQPLIFAEWLRQLAAVLYREPLGDLFEQVGDYNPPFLARVLTDRDGAAARWCPAQTADDTVPCAAAMQTALQRALHNLREHFGKDMRAWRWGEAHPSLFRHAAFGGLPWLSAWFNVETSSPGGMDSVNVSGYRYDEASGRYVGEAGPAFRAIYDLAEPDRSLFVLGTGQSGNPLAAQYRDMTGAWRTGAGFPLLTSAERVAQAAVRRTILLPH